MGDDLEAGLNESGGANDTVIPISRTDSKPQSCASTSEHGQEDINHLSTTQSNHISLSDVDPVDVQVRKLAVSVDISPSFYDPSRYLSRKRNQDGEAMPQIKQI